MGPKRYQLIYDIEFADQMKAIEQKYYSFIRRTIEEQLTYAPDRQTRNRKQLDRLAPFGTRWELRFGVQNRFRVFYIVNPAAREVRILAMGVKIRERLYIGGKEVKL